MPLAVGSRSGTEAEVRERVELDDAAFEEQTKMVRDSLSDFANGMGRGPS